MVVVVDFVGFVFFIDIDVVVVVVNIVVMALIVVTGYICFGIMSK